MNAEEIVAALDLPPGTRVGQRIAKKMLLENGARTAADKRQINDGIDELQWLAALKPTNIGVPAYRDEVREYLEIALLRLALRSDAKAGRLVELVHRAIPYPVLLAIECDGACDLTAAHLRWSQGEAGQTVLDGVVIGMEGEAGEFEAVFLQALALGKQPRSSMLTLYQGWIDTLLALQAARVTGRFVVLSTPEEAARRAEGLQEYERLAAEIEGLRTAAEKEVQIARRVDQNLAIKRLQAAQAEALLKL